MIDDGGGFLREWVDRLCITAGMEICKSYSVPHLLNYWLMFEKLRFGYDVHLTSGGLAAATTFQSSFQVSPFHYIILLALSLRRTVFHKSY